MVYRSVSIKDFIYGIYLETAALEPPKNFSISAFDVGPEPGSLPKNFSMPSCVIGPYVGSFDFFDVFLDDTEGFFAGAIIGADSCSDLNTIGGGEVSIGLLMEEGAGGGEVSYLLPTEGRDIVPTSSLEPSPEKAFISAINCSLVLLGGTSMPGPTNDLYLSMSSFFDIPERDLLLLGCLFLGNGEVCLPYASFSPPNNSASILCLKISSRRDSAFLLFASSICPFSISLILD